MKIPENRSRWRNYDRLTGKRYGTAGGCCPGTPLLWVLRDNLGLTSVKYTCGIAQCGMCTVLIDGEAQRSCVVNVEDAQGSEITTIEGLPDDHPVKVAWLEKQVPQCGYCQPGIMLQTVAFLSKEPDPSDARINEVMDDVVCRCGSHPRIKQAIRAAAAMTAKQECCAMHTELTRRSFLKHGS